MSLEKKVRERIGDPWTHYNENYPGWTQTQLRRSNSELAYRLKRTEYWIKIPTDFGDNLVAYRNEHYPTLTRGQIKQVNEPFYYQLRKTGELEKIPVTYRTHSADELINEYENNHPGLTRGELATKNRSLYNRMYRANVLSAVPLKTLKKETPLVDPETDPDMRIYRTIYPDCIIGKLIELNWALYQRLRKKKLLSYLPRRHDNTKPTHKKI